MRFAVCGAEFGSSSAVKTCRFVKRRVRSGGVTPMCLNCEEVPQASGTNLRNIRGSID